MFVGAAASSGEPTDEAVDLRLHGGRNIRHPLAFYYEQHLLQQHQLRVAGLRVWIERIRDTNLAPRMCSYYCYELHTFGFRYVHFKVAAEHEHGYLRGKLGRVVAVFVLHEQSDARLLEHRLQRGCIRKHARRDGASYPNTGDGRIEVGPQAVIPRPRHLARRQRLVALPDELLRQCLRPNRPWGSNRRQEATGRRRAQGGQRAPVAAWNATALQASAGSSSW
jgi:hypothetical protein